MSRRSRGEPTTEAEELEVLPTGVPTEFPGITLDELQPGERALPAPSPEASAAPASEAEPAPAPRYAVAPGRSLTVRRGHLGEGTALRPADLSAEQVSTLVASGHLIAR
jgi:hypothetical protein